MEVLPLRLRARELVLLVEEVRAAGWRRLRRAQGASAADIPPPSPAYHILKQPPFRSSPSRCVIPSSSSFLGEPCTHKDQCQNSFAHGHLDVTCAPTRNDADDPGWKCVLDEEANTVSPYASTCR